MGYRIDLKGQKFDRLTVIEYAFNKNRKSYWICKCQCGNVKIVESYKLRIGHTRSCGCIAKETFEILKQKCTKHNMVKTRMYKIWQNMKRRCYSPKEKGYKYYGGRGIKVCDEWLEDFINFYNWAMNNGYREDLTIDRINVNGNYEPNNCRWADRITQANNKRNNHFLTYNNETLTINQWARKLNIPRETIKTRIKKNLEIDKILKGGKENGNIKTNKKK